MLSIQLHSVIFVRLVRFLMEGFRWTTRVKNCSWWNKYVSTLFRPTLLFPDIIFCSCAPYFFVDIPNLEIYKTKNAVNFLSKVLWALLSSFLEFKYFSYFRSYNRMFLVGKIYWNLRGWNTFSIKSFESRFPIGYVVLYLQISIQLLIWCS